MPPPPAFDRGSFASDPLMDKENSAPRVLAAAHASKLSGAARAGGTARAARPALGRDTAPALLRLGRPEHVPCLRFDDARAGTGKTLPLRVQNDTPYAQEARFERVPRDDGFMVDPDRVALPPGASHVVRVSWCPSKASRHAHNSEMLVTLDDGEGDAGRLRWGKKMSLAVRVRGSAVAPAAARSVSEKAQPGALSYTFHARGARGNLTEKQKQSAPMSRVAPVGRTLKLMKMPDPETSSPREANARTQTPEAKKKRRVPLRPDFASFKTGAGLAVARERAMSEWINSVIAPPYSDLEASGTSGTSGAAARARARRSAERTARERLWRLYSSDAEVRDVILRVEAQIDLGKLRLRGVRDGFDVDPSGINAKGGGSFIEDTQLREAFRDALGSYGVFWLRAAVDVIVGVPGAVGDGDRDVLGTFSEDVAIDAKRERLERSRLVAALMRDEEVELAYGSEGRGVAPFAEGYAEALAGTVLKRTLLLVFLLDRAQAGTGTAAPLLFRRGARLKTSGDVIRAALQASCHGEGDILRRLGHYGYKLHHAQEPVREYDFRTENLALELRDGVRLCRLVDTLGNARGDASALARASFPAQARVAKRRNVALAIETAVETFGVEGLRGMNPDDVVDGNLAATATALYHLRVHFQGPENLGDWDEVHRETESWRERRRAQISEGVFRRKFFKDTLASAAEAGQDKSEFRRASDEDAVAEAMFALELADARLESTTTKGSLGSSDDEARNFEAEHTVVIRCELALLRWARAVAATLGVEVSDFSGSFADGAALCALIHAYAPELVHLREIRRVDFVESDSTITTKKSGEKVAFQTKTVNDAVASNFALAARAVDLLRGTESFLPPLPFDERDALLDARGLSKELCVGFLLELRRALLRRKAEHAAARVVQNAWLRRRRARFEVPEHLPLRWALERRTNAALTIQNALRGAFGRRDAAKRVRAILVAQTVRRGSVARRTLRVAIHAATRIASCARGMFAREEAMNRRFATLIAQTRLRGASARRKYVATRAAAVSAQRWRRASVTRRAFEALREKHRAATKIAAAFKGFCDRFDYQDLRATVVERQRVFRACVARNELRRAFVFTRAAVLTAQTIRRGAVERRAFVNAKLASVTIQRHVRGFIARERYLRVSCAALTCQASRRGALERRAFLELRDAAVVAQRAARDAARARRRHAATVEIQRHVRGFIARERYLRVSCAALTCQASRRGALERRAFLELRDASSVCALIRREAVARREAREARAARLRALAAADEASARRAAAAAAAEMEAREVAAAELAAARRADEDAERSQALERAAALKAETKRRVLAKTPGGRRDGTVNASSSLCTPARLSLQARAVKARRLEFEILHESAETRAATSIQAAWRGWTCRMDFAMLRWAAVTFQAFARGAAARRRFAEEKHVSAKYAVSRDAIAMPAPARVAAAPPSRSRLANVSTAASRRVGGGTAVSSKSLLAWSTASSVAASSDSEADDDEAYDETYDTPDPKRESRDDTGVSPVSNASQDLSRFDSFPHPDLNADEYCGYSDKRDAGFAAAAAAADVLAGARSVGDVRRALSALASATRASGGAREAASSPRALHALLRVMRRCDRSEGHKHVLRLAHDVLETLSGDESGPARAVFEAKDAVVVVTEHMQMCRDRFELVGAAARTLANLCGDAARARAVARAERGRVTRRVRGICEILGNTLAAWRHALSGTDAFRNKNQADRAEARSMRALEATVRSMRELVARLEGCEGEVRYEPAFASRRATEEEARKPAFAPTRFAEASKRESSFRVSVEPEPLTVSTQSPRGLRVREKKPREDASRRPLASSGNGFGRRAAFGTTREGKNGNGKENGSRLDSRADPDPDPFWFASRGFGLRDRFASSPIMSPRYVR